MALVLALIFTLNCGGGTSSAPSTGGGGTGGSTSGGGGQAIQIQEVAPSKIMVGVPQAGGTVYGTNFTASSTVLFDGAAVPTTFEQTSLQFQSTADWTVAQKHTVQVSDPANGKSNVATVEFYAPQPAADLFAGQGTQYMSEDLIPNGLVPDLDGDGRADLITLVPGIGQASSQYVPLVRHGQADGTFSASTPLLSSLLQVSPNMVLAGDFNGDGHTDLIFLGPAKLGSQPTEYQVALNDGTGHFTLGTTGSLPPNANQRLIVPVAVGDFNHDGKLDFIYEGATDSQPFSLFFGNGDGTFGAPETVGAATSEIPLIINAADLNGDGYTDLVYWSVPVGSLTGEIRMLLSGPSGVYSDSQVAGLPTSSWSFVVSDFNNDGIPDIFAIDGSGLGEAYLGVGDGTFNPTGNAVVAYDGFLVIPPFVTADFDNDGNLDIATRTALTGPDEILFLWGDGTGNFVPQPTASDQSFTLQVGDVNGDGLPDIFGGVSPGFAYPSVVLGRKDRNIPSAQVLNPPFLGWLSAGDVFGNGFNDLLVSGGGNGNPGIPATIYGYQPNGSITAVGHGPGYNATALVDLNGDGIPDMVGFTATSMLVWKGDGTGAFQTLTNQVSLPAGFAQFYFRDMDGDGNMDVVLPGAILYGKGNFQFDVAPMNFIGNFVVGDFDGDGIPDIAVAGSGIWFGEGKRTFSAPAVGAPLSDTIPPYATQVVADINGDGKEDLILTDEQYVEIYTSLGRQGFALDQELLINGYGVTISSVTVTDLNGDKLPDIAVGMIGPDDVVLFINDGTGKYQMRTYAIGVNSVLSISADFNNDGKPDLAFVNYGYDFKPPTATVLLQK